MKNHNDLVMAYIGFYLKRIDEIPEIIGGGGSDRPTKKLIPINIINQKEKNSNEKGNDQVKPNEEQKPSEQQKSNEQIKSNNQEKFDEKPKTHDKTIPNKSQT